MLTRDVLVEEIAAAHHRIRPHVRETPLYESTVLGEATGSQALLKLENLQRTGSFKLRGAVNRLLTLDAEVRVRGVVAASSGNHGAAVAHAGRVLGCQVTIFVPESVSSVKLTAMQRSGADVRVFGTDGLDTELHARRFAEANGRAYISPYNDLAVVAGQGTIGVELRRQGDPLDAIIAAVGGGGLIAGIGADLKARWPSVRIVGAVPENSPVMAESVKAGRVVEMASRPTLSDGTAGGVEADAITFDLCRTLVDDWIRIPEREIAGAMRHCLTSEHLLVEGAAGVAVAALHRCAPALRGARVAVIVCGANVSLECLRAIL
jgi:threonine dehydratase